MRELSRRSFLTGAALGSAALAGASLLGCSPNASADGDSNRQETPSGESTVDELFEPPEPIADIAETEETEILVLGAGIAGTCCALKAVEDGSQVTVFQKTATASTSGVAMCAMNVEECHKHNGLEKIDFSKRILELNDSNSGGSNFPLLKRFFEMEVEAVTWFLEESKALDMPPAAWINDQDPCLVYAPDGISPVVAKMAEKAEGLGAVYHYSTPAVQLVQDNSGRVIGAVGQKEDGSYIQVNASKGVVIATGDYSYNPELVNLWCPAANDYKFGGMTERTGDGHLMAKWIGAKISPYPHAKMIHPVPFSSSQKRVFWMKTDLHGNRVFPENLTYGWQCNALKGHPEDTAVQFFDSNYHTYLEEMGFPDMTQETLDSYIDVEKFAFKADTIEELGELAGVTDTEALKSSVERWNELCEQGEDTDFFLDSKYLKPIDTPPYYAIKYVCQFLAIFGGMQVTEDSQVVDEGDIPVPGLYAVGNSQGGFYTGTDYPYSVNGGSTGRCCVFGYMVGKNLAEA